MGADQKVVFVLELIVAIGPLAVYFLALGLLNSRPHPYLIGLRADFLLLSIAFFPLMVVPLAALAARGWLGSWFGGVAAMALVLWWAIQSGLGSGWVIYNIDGRHCLDAVGRACRRLGWETTEVGERIVVTSPKLEIQISTFSILRNVTLNVTISDGHELPGEVDRLGEALARELDAEALLPSPTGAGLVMVGSILLAVPMGYLAHHVEAVVEVVRRIFLA
ncbi:MAG: hypothetical protein GXY44_16000 [Phycisphaerales bacterium]|nr:hypothetical protein [Phycisphaerales bacterium]